MKLKKEKVYILIRKNHKTYKKEIEARTFIYRDVKFNLQGDSKSGYLISDNRTGMLCGVTYFEKLKNLDCKKLDYFIENIMENYLYKVAIKNFDNAIIEEVI